MSIRQRSRFVPVGRSNVAPNLNPWEGLMSARGRLRVWSSLAAAIALMMTLAACGDDDDDAGGGGEGDEAGSIWVLLPDTATSDRWENDDRRYFAEAFEAAGVGEGEECRWEEHTSELQSRLQLV